MSDYTDSVIDTGLDAIQEAAEEKKIDTDLLDEDSHAYYEMRENVMEAVRIADDESGSYANTKNMFAAGLRQARNYIEDVPLRGK